MTILHTECVKNCAGGQFDFANERVASCDDIPHVAPGTNVTITGSGTAADPYVFSAASPAAADGSETKVQAGAYISITGSGTVADPYVVAGVAPGTPADGSETKLSAGTNVTITGAGTVANPYVINAAAGAVADGSETKVQAGLHTTVTGTGTAGDPYVVGSDSPRFPAATLGQQFLGLVNPPVNAYIAQIGPVSLTNPSATENMMVMVSEETREWNAISTQAGLVGVFTEISFDGVTWNNIGGAYLEFTGPNQKATFACGTFVRPHGVAPGATVNMWVRVGVTINNAAADMEGDIVASLIGMTFING